MSEFYQRALKKLDKLTHEQCRELFVSAAGEVKRFEDVLDSLPVGIFICDEKHKLLRANKFAQWLVPMNNNEGALLWNVVKNEKLSAYIKNTLLSNDRIMEREMDVEHLDRFRLLSVSVVPLVRNRRVSGSLVYMKDVTDKRKGESRLRQAEKLASLTTLAAAVAHEIKNPLGSISIHLQLLKKAIAKKTKSPDKTTDKYFKVLNEEVDRLNRIIVDFLFAVRPMTLELREGDLNALVSELAEFVSYELERANIRCILELDKKMPLIMMDDRYMKQALLNLIKNAQTAMPKGGLLTITTEYAENEARIFIRDTGTGISEENLAKIFEPYFTTSKTGTGLGLTLVFKIIKEHHGEISVDSEMGKGTEFEITLPVHQKEWRMIAYNAENVRS
ncbi:MAG: ATP-binding protein [Treponema sp.]|jgi:signal transduction histidine kinase|nr:ATP-binding protein [Treponema sp.]